MCKSKLVNSVQIIGFTCISLVIASTSLVQAAAMQCGDRTALLKALSEKYKEKPRALGLSATGKAMFEVYTSTTGTWTMSGKNSTSLCRSPLRTVHASFLAHGSSLFEAPFDRSHQFTVPGFAMDLPMAVGMQQH